MAWLIALVADDASMQPKYINTKFIVGFPTTMVLPETATETIHAVEI